MNKLTCKNISRLKGSIPPLITPFRDGEVDYETYAALVDMHAARGSHGILVNGTTSEPAALTVAERNRLIDVAMRRRKNNLFVVAATGSQSFAESKQLTDYAVQAGVDALLIVTPYYSKPPQRGIIEYYRALTREHSIPWMIYHIPGRAAVDVKLETLQAIKAKDENFVGMKHASLDLDLVSACLHAFGADFRVFAGLEEMSFPMMAIGACGLMNAAGNLNPKGIAGLCEAVFAGDMERARALHYRYYELNKSLFYDINPIPMKYMMKRLGLIPDNEHRLPLCPASPELERRLDKILEALQDELPQPV